MEFSNIRYGEPIEAFYKFITIDNSNNTHEHLPLGDLGSLGDVMDCFVGEVFDKN
jgi:hypothetical protein